MPELPEVHTTATGLQKVLPGLVIKDVWTDLNTKDKRQKETVKNPRYFKKFRAAVVGAKILRVHRRAKNVLIGLSPRRGSGQSNNQTILIHMKMTGHLLFGRYVKKQVRVESRKSKVESWEPEEKDGPLRDPYNRFIHLVFTFSNGQHLAFSDTRKFGKITLLEDLATNIHTAHLGPEPLEKDFDLEKFKLALLKKLHPSRKGRASTKIKTVLMDQSIISGIGNIYSDEMLWLSGIHPLSRVALVPEKKLRELYKAMKLVLRKGIDFGGDSTSDYRNIYGERGEFQHKHNVYQRKGEGCKKRGCGGTIERMIVGGRSAHFCPKHQKKYEV